MSVTYLWMKAGAFKTATLVFAARVLIPPIVVLLRRDMNTAALAL